MKHFEFELGLAARRLVSDILQIKEKETVVITADTGSSEEVVNATAREVFAVGARPMVIWLTSALGVGKMADNMLPQKPLTAALVETDVWIEFNKQWLLYSTPFDIAVEKNKELRYVCLVEMNPDMMVRTIGRIDIPLLEEFLNEIAAVTERAKHVRVTTPTGTELEFENHPKRKLIIHSGIVPKGTYEMLPGQISWTPALDTVEGQLVFDGSLVPPVGLLENPIVLTIKAGKITAIDGEKEAREFEKWLAGFNDEKMYQLAHISYGFNPGARLTGNIVEDERIWGATEWGIGNIGPRLIPDIPGGIKASSHCDGICLNSSIWLDGQQILDKGRIVNHKKLQELEEKLT